MLINTPGLFVCACEQLNLCWKLARLSVRVSRQFMVHKIPFQGILYAAAMAMALAATAALAAVCNRRRAGPALTLLQFDAHCGALFSMVTLWPPQHRRPWREFASELIGQIDSEL